MCFPPVCRSILAVALLASAPASPAPPSKPAAPAAEKCGSCHPLPPPTGAHARHARERIDCAHCHGRGFSDGGTDPALHQNGSTDVAAEAGWKPAARSCANACHARETWPRSDRGAPQGAEKTARRDRDGGGEHGDDHHHHDGDHERHEDRDHDDGHDHGHRDRDYQD